jgi:hypothetical protein
MKVQSILWRPVDFLNHFSQITTKLNNYVIEDETGLWTLSRTFFVISTSLNFGPSEIRSFLVGDFPPYTMVGTSIFNSFNLAEIKVASYE